MNVRKFNLWKNVDAVKPCPACGQKFQFIAKSEQVCEDGCEVWIECICGHDPHKFNERLESVMGGCDEDNIRMALECWNDASGHNVTIQQQPLVAIRDTESETMTDEQAQELAVWMDKLASECTCIGVDRPCYGLISGGPCDDCDHSDWDEDAPESSHTQTLSHERL